MKFIELGNTPQGVDALITFRAEQEESPFNSYEGVQLIEFLDLQNLSLGEIIYKCYLLNKEKIEAEFLKADMILKGEHLQEPLNLVGYPVVEPSLSELLIVAEGVNVTHYIDEDIHITASAKAISQYGTELLDITSLIQPSGASEVSEGLFTFNSNDLTQITLSVDHGGFHKEIVISVSQQIRELTVDQKLKALSDKYQDDLDDIVMRMIEDKGVVM